MTATKKNIKVKAYTLREIHVDAMVVNQNALHLEICLLAILLVFEFDKTVLQTVTSTLVSDDLAG